MTRSTLVFICLFLGFTAVLLNSCTKCSSDPASEQSSIQGSASPSAEVSGKEEDLKIETLKEGTGTVARAGKKITVHYTGRLADGKVFDSSEQRQAPFPFTLGSGQVIQGWEKGVAGMKVGERRKLTIPPAMGYGARGVGSVIPPNATLMFEVELLNVE